MLVENATVNEQIFMGLVEVMLRSHSAPFVMPATWSVTGVRLVGQPFTYGGGEQEGAFITMEIQVEARKSGTTE